VTNCDGEYILDFLSLLLFLQNACSKILPMSRCGISTNVLPRTTSALCFTKQRVRCIQLAALDPPPTNPIFRSLESQTHGRLVLRSFYLCSADSILLGEEGKAVLL
jgi:hypothetical protein